MPAQRAPKGEAGFLLIFLMMGVAVMMIMLTVAGQSWTFQMRREMELELVYRGEQYMNGLAAFRKANGNAFPVGDLKVLAQKNPTGIRFMRKLYKNPMDPNGRWQYLYLHPGGTGFINPCAVGGGVGFNDPTVGPGFGGGRGFGAGRGGSGATTDFGRPGARGIAGSRSPDDDDDSDEPGRGLPTGAARSGLSAMDPKTFKETGIHKMNLPIVGVVNCQMVESIRTYKGQTWLSNWAFTPLAQGEFGMNAQAGGSPGSSVGLVGGGIGANNEVFTNPALRNSNQRLNSSDSSNQWRRSQQAPPPPPPGGQDNTGQDNGPNTQPSDPHQPPHPPQPPNPNAPPDPNRPEDPNQIHSDPDDPDGTYDDEDDESDDEDEDEGDDEEDEDPNAPVDPNTPSPSETGSASLQS